MSGHLAGCVNIQQSENVPLCSYKSNCRKNVIPQSCMLLLCAEHWNYYCLFATDSWTIHLSYCANQRADSLRIVPEKRKHINHTNIEITLALSSDPKYHHVSKDLREVVDIDISIENNGGDETFIDDLMWIKTKRVIKFHSCDEFETNSYHYDPVYTNIRLPESYTDPFVQSEWYTGDSTI